MRPITRINRIERVQGKGGNKKLIVHSKKEKLTKRRGADKRNKKVAFVRGFKKPSIKIILAALDEHNADALEGFPRLPHPSHPSDWLAGYKEEGQTVASFLSTCPWMGNRKAPRYKGQFEGGKGSLNQRYPDGTLYLVELKGAEDNQQGLLDLPQLANFCSAYIGLPVSILDPLCLEEKSSGPVLQGRRLVQRRHDSKRQLNTASILHVLRELDTPTNCLALLAVTIQDLYQV